MTYSEPVRNQKPNRLGTGNRTEPNRSFEYIPRNRTEPNREPEIHQFPETETEPNRTDPTLLLSGMSHQVDPSSISHWLKPPWQGEVHLLCATSVTAPIAHFMMPCTLDGGPNDDVH